MSSEQDARHALIIGGNRGIGLHFVKTLISRSWKVTATMRAETQGDASHEDLKATGAAIVFLDYTKEDTIVDAARKLDNETIDLLVNCAATSVQPPGWQDHGVTDLLDRFHVMAIGPLTAIKYFLPHLRKSPHGIIANITSDLASIQNNDDERYVGYKMAKAALNQMTRTLHHDFRKNNESLSIVALHPGFVITRLSLYRGDVDIDESVQGMVGIIEGLKVGESGMYVDWKGNKMEW